MEGAILLEDLLNIEITVLAILGHCVVERGVHTLGLHQFKFKIIYAQGVLESDQHFRFHSFLLLR